MDSNTTILLDDFIGVHLGKSLYELTLKTPFYVAATGGAVNHDYKIPFKHRLVRVDLKHAASTDADSVDAFTWTLSRQHTKGVFMPLVAYTGSVISNFLEQFGEGYEFDGVLYRFTENTTATDRLYLKMTIQLLGGN